MNRLHAAVPAAAFAAASLAASALGANSVSITPPATATFAVTLNGLDQSATYTMSVPVSYTSNSGNKFATNGWHITATSTTFKGAATGKTLPTTASSFTSIQDTAACTGTTCSKPTNTLTYPISIPAAATAPAAVSVFSAQPGSGVGSNTLSMQVSVAVPANTYADTYTSTLTLAIVEGP